VLPETIEDAQPKLQRCGKNYYKVSTKAVYRKFNPDSHWSAALYKDFLNLILLERWEQSFSRFSNSASTDPVKGQGR
jgi:hypothetical protein